MAVQWGAPSGASFDATGTDGLFTDSMLDAQSGDGFGEELGALSADNTDQVSDECLQKAREAAGKAASDAACKNTGVTDCGIKRSAQIKGALNAAILGINTYTSLRIAEMQYDLAKDYAAMSKWYRDHYFNNYHPIEKSLIDEAMNDPEYKYNKHDLTKGQMLVTAKLGFIGKLEKTVSCTGRYCTGQRQAITNDLLIEQATVENSVCGLASRHAEDEEITRNAKRWERRNNVLKLGRDLPTQSVSYGGLASGIFGSVGEQAAKGAMGAAEALGFGGMRRDTRYPPRRGPLTAAPYQANVPQVQYEPVHRVKSAETRQEIPRPQENKPIVLGTPGGGKFGKSAKENNQVVITPDDADYHIYRDRVNQGWYTYNEDGGYYEW